MKNTCRLLLLFCLCACAGSAGATQITIQDPSNAPTSFTVTPITTSTFTVSFANSCMSALNPGDLGYNDRGCFSFTNRTGFDWTSIELTTTDTPSNGAFTCASDVFAAERCTFDPTTGEYTLFFTSGTVSSQSPVHSYYTISESDLDPGSLTFQATVTFATAPEPPGLLLVGTGLLGTAVMLRTRRRASA